MINLLLVLKMFEHKSVAYETKKRTQSKKGKDILRLELEFCKRILYDFKNVIILGF